MMNKKIVIAAVSVLLLGCLAFVLGIWQSRTKAITVVYFDSEENSHPSVRDGRVEITNTVAVAQLDNLLKRRTLINQPCACAPCARVYLKRRNGAETYCDMRKQASELFSVEGKYFKVDGPRMLQLLSSNGVDTNKLAR